MGEIHRKICRTEWQIRQAWRRPWIPASSRALEEAQRSLRCHIEVPVPARAVWENGEWLRQPESRDQEGQTNWSIEAVSVCRPNVKREDPAQETGENTRLAPWLLRYDSQGWSYHLAQCAVRWCPLAGWCRLQTCYQMCWLALQGIFVCIDDRSEAQSWINVHRFICSIAT